MPIFLRLLSDLFPGVVVIRARNMEFEHIIEDTIKKRKLFAEPEFILKCVEF
jgi:hypothetical protein